MTDVTVTSHGGPIPHRIRRHIDALALSLDALGYAGWTLALGLDSDTAVLAQPRNRHGTALQGPTEGRKSQPGRSGHPQRKRGHSMTRYQDLCLHAWWTPDARNKPHTCRRLDGHDGEHVCSCGATTEATA